MLQTEIKDFLKEKKAEKKVQKTRSDEPVDS